MRRLRHWLAGRPLRARLVAMLLVVVAIALAVSGFAATTALRGYLIGQVDARIAATARAVAEPPRQPPLDPGASGGSASVPDGPVGPVSPGRAYVVLTDASGAVERVVATSEQAVADPPELPEWDLPTVNQAAGRPITVSSQSGSQRWRVIALPRSDGTGSVLVAASIAEIDAIVRQLVIWQLAIAFVVLVSLALIAQLIVRRSLAPLVAVEETAAKVAAGDLSVRAPQSDPRTEVGSLANSFNTMVGNLQSAFEAQAASEAAARASEASARASELRMRRFVADASHELRTPLTSIRGYSELYRIGAVAPGEQLDEAMGRIEDEAARMGLLVDDLLLLARLDRQRPLDQVEVDLVELCAAAVTSAKVAAPARRIDVEVQETPEALVVLGDAARLRQVLDNLLANAVRYTPADSPIVVRVGAQDPGWAEVEVVDQGPGLSAQAASRVFERFYREDGARSRAHGGSGLGLAIVAAIVAAHGGRVELDTAPGRGATFRVVLPRAHPAGGTVQTAIDRADQRA